MADPVESAEEVSRDHKMRCPHPECGWFTKFDATDYADEMSAEHATEAHFDAEHRGQARVKVVLEKDVALHPAQDPSRVVDNALERFEDEEEIVGYEAAYASIEVLEDPDVIPEGDRL